MPHPHRRPHCHRRRHPHRPLAPSFSRQKSPPARAAVPRRRRHRLQAWTRLTCQQTCGSGSREEAPSLPRRWRRLQLLLPRRRGHERCQRVWRQQQPAACGRSEAPARRATAEASQATVAAAAAAVGATGGVSVTPQMIAGGRPSARRRALELPRGARCHPRPTRRRPEPHTRPLRPPAAARRRFSDVFAFLTSTSVRE